MSTDEKKIDTKEHPAPADKDKAINENELENVSGGLWGITIIDACENSFVLDKCFTNIWGQCPKLIIESKTVSEQGIPTYCFSCAKGCYKKLTYIMHVNK